MKECVVFKGLLKVGVVWRVGNGKSISIWGQKWIPRSLSFQVKSSVKILLDDAKLRELVIEELGYWNEKLIY